MCEYIKAFNIPINSQNRDFVTHPYIPPLHGKKSNITYQKLTQAGIYEIKNGLNCYKCDCKQKPSFYPLS